jgi:hypothetical protein
MKSATTAQGFIDIMKEKARAFADKNHGILTKRQFGSVINKELSTVSGIINDPTFGPYLKEKKKKGKGPVSIPLQTVLDYIDNTFEIC